MHVSHTPVRPPAPLQNRPSDAVRWQAIARHLTARLNANWIVEQTSDPMGEISIVVMPMSDDAARTYILFEAGGQARVGIVEDDAWQVEHDYQTLPQAAEHGILAAINARAPCLV